MDKYLDEALCEKYPKIFAQRHGDPAKTAMCWGFACGDGWYNILDNLCGAIQDYCDNVKQYRDGKLVPVCEQVVATQVKEKFGELRFYYDGGNDVVHGMVAMAEYMASHTCEQCGKPGKLRTIRGWVTTACDEHYQYKVQ